MERFDDRVAMFLRFASQGFGGALDFLAVFVAACDEEDCLAFEAVPTGDRVCGYGRVGTADVGHVVDVVERRGNREFSGI